jgi:hypothetical protein
MFDDLDDIEEFQVDVNSPQCLANELIAALKANDRKREKLALGSFDDGIEKAVHNTGEDKPGAMDAFKKWLILIFETIKGLVKDDLEKHFVWEKHGHERAGAAMVRRLQSVVNSGTFDAVKVVPAQPATKEGPVVLMLGRGGTQFDDLEEPQNFWKRHGSTLVRGNHCCIKRLKDREIDRILEALVEKDVARRGLIGHFFSENGSYFWCHVMERWEKCPPAGLPELAKVLVGIVYDSAQCTMWSQSGDPMEYAGACGDMTNIKDWRKQARHGGGRHVTMNATLAMCRDVFGKDSKIVDDVGDITGPVFKGVIEAFAHRGNIDDAIFDNNHWDMHKGIMREPADISRLMFVSKSDPTLFWESCLHHCEWMKKERGADIELEIYEQSINCSMHRDDPKGYFERVEAWLAQVRTPGLLDAKAELLGA